MTHPPGSRGKGFVQQLLEEPEIAPPSIPTTSATAPLITPREGGKAVANELCGRKVAVLATDGVEQLRPQAQRQQRPRLRGVDLGSECG